LPFAGRLRLPLICAPMLRVSGIELVSAACTAGVIGAFPTANAASLEELDQWLTRLDTEADLARAVAHPLAPYCPNLVMRREAAQIDAEVALFARHHVELVITSVGSPASVVPRLHALGCLVFADVVSLHHARKAVDAGVDGLVLLTAGAGGHTGWANPFAFVRAVQAMFDGPLILSGGLSDGQSLHAATVLGCSLGLMGTRFIATRESLASDGYKQMLVTSSLDDVRLTRAFTGLPASFLEPSILAAGFDLAELPEDLTVDQARARFGGGSRAIDTPRRWAEIWSAGHSVSGVDGVPSAGDVVERIEGQWRASREGVPADKVDAIGAPRASMLAPTRQA
ncbi:MAG: nitronate monooxygenase, partial [Rhizobacter sp.]|nr:nitronate monooxygenase [Rhizobacter sp.]